MFTRASTISRNELTTALSIVKNGPNSFPPNATGRPRKRSGDRLDASVNRLDSETLKWISLKLFTENKMKTKLALTLVVSTAALLRSEQAQTKPNIVFILMDNLGYGELGVYGGGVLRGAPTPALTGSRPKERD